MLTELDLQKLISYHPAHPVLSVYLNVDPTTGSVDAYRLRLRQLLKHLEAPDPQDIEAIQRFIEHQYDWSGRSLALFSCAPDQYFRSFSLSLPIRDRARLLDSPYVKPLADLFDNYGHYGVVLVDQQGARLFYLHLGELQEHEGTMGQAVRHTKRGGGSQAAGRKGGVAGQTRYSEEVAERNIKEAARFATRFFQEKRVRRILVGATEENSSRFLSQMPKAWQSLVMGTFPIDMTAGYAYVLEKALEVAQQAEVEKEEQLVDAIITAAAKGREGVIGLDDTLGAIHTSRVYTLVLSEGFRAGGSRCQSCGYLTAQSPKKCPYCQGEFETIEDAVELAIRKVFSDGGEVMVIHNSEALEKAGRIAGLLRY